MGLDLNPQFLRALDLMEESDKNLFITGKAGTGKSTLLEYFRSRVTPEKKDGLVVLAPTGVAALNVKGQTVHSLFRFGIDVTVDKIIKGEYRPRDRKLYKNLKTIIIDEISMVRADLLDCVDAFLRMYGPDSTKSFGGVQMIFIGDLYQLSPVVSRDEQRIFRTIYSSPYFFSAKALESTDMEVVNLETIYRQKDQQFINLLNKVRDNEASNIDIAELNQQYLPNSNEWNRKEFVITLTSTNKQADEINASRLDQLDSKSYHSKAKINGDFKKEYYPTAENLYYKSGAQVMLLTNEPKGRWVNGSIGIIDRIDDDESVWVRLRDSQATELVAPYKWEIFAFSAQGGKIVSERVGTFTQYPFRLAWAVTIHKSQGKTFEDVIIDVGRGTFASGQLYVALSRCTSFEGIQLKTPIRRNHIILDRRIYEFLSAPAYHKATKNVPSIDKDAPFMDKQSLIKEAIATESELEIVYRNKSKAESERVIIPIEIGLLEYQNEAGQTKKFYGVRAYCTKAEDVRLFSITNIRKIKKL